MPRPSRRSPEAKRVLEQIVVVGAGVGVGLRRGDPPGQGNGFFVPCQRSIKTRQLHKTSNVAGMPKCPFESKYVQNAL